MNKIQTVDVLRTQGIMAKGYGTMPQIVARDERLTPEAKAIYAYFCSFAGAGFEPVFPSRNLMMKELNMSKDRYYKHLKQLVELNYVAIERCKIGNIYSKNIYTLVIMPDMAVTAPEEKESIKAKRPSRVSKRLDHKRGDSKPVPLQNEQPQTSEEDASAEEPASAGNYLAAQLGIQALIEKRPEHKELIQYIFMAVEDMIASEQITINGSIKKKAAIKQMIGNLRMEHIETIVNNISQSGQTIRHKKAYIQSCIGNSLFDITGPLDFSKKKSIHQENQNQEDSEKTKRKELYEQNPELKDLDNQIFALGSRISKAILSGNELQTKALQIEQSRLIDKLEDSIQQLTVTSNA